INHFHSFRSLLGITAQLIRAKFMVFYNNKLAEDVITSHWHPNITITTVFDNQPHAYGRVQDLFKPHIIFTPDRLSYFPIVYVNDYWNLKSDYKPITSENKYWTEGNDDMLKQMLLDTNIYLLIITVIVSCAHSFFEFLAFKNDIQFWNSRKDLTGLSVSGILFGVFQSMVVLLYIFDNGGNWMLLIGSGIGCLIDAWKITKVVDVSLDFTQWLGPFPRIRFQDKSTYVQSHTREYDRMALKYLSMIIFPIFIGYSVYSVIYNEHKGWYSFALSLIYGFLLTFGFIMMTPQLFINYKMKSVAHLPWRMLTYKALNTFIDDIFAFVIRTPTMYRIGCLRDDVVFFVYLYQRWIYPIDTKRVNEFGLSGESKVLVENKQKDE
ncbi:hypothetical protein MXB_2573, partial [Myxobolus squamalis]